MTSTIAVFGGSFDPPHVGHVLVPSYVLARGLADRVIVAPTFEHPMGKSSGADPGADFLHRLGLCRVAMAHHGPAVSVSDLEARLRRPGRPSFTIDLLQAVQEQNPGARVRLCIGSDLENELERWREGAQIRQRFDPIYVPRAGHAGEQEAALPRVSSSLVRAMLASSDYDAAACLVPAKVLAALRARAAGMTRRVILVGAGNVAAHVGPWLAERGHEVTVVAARALCNGQRLPVETARAAAGVYVLVSDPHLPAVAKALVGQLPPGLPVLHAAGARIAASPAALGALAQVGHPVATLHPICSLRGARHTSGFLRHAAFGVEGDPAAAGLCTELLGGQTQLDLSGLSASGRAAYHGACSLVANHLSVLLERGRQSMEPLVATDHPDRVAQALQVLLASSLDNVTALGFPGGVSGPAARGDAATVEAHAQALGPDAAALYRMLSADLVRLLGV